jgi:hypothetical protein
MRNSIVTGMLALSFFALPGFAQQAPVGAVVTASEPGKVAIMEAVKVTAVVTAIDKATRTVTLKGPKGRSFDVVAGEEVRNFDQINVNDHVVAEYVRALSMEVRKPGGVRERTDSADEARTKLGDKPGGAVSHRVTVLADVIDVDR